MVDRTRIEAQLVLHEGLREQAYMDTEGNWTIGVGYNITGRGWDSLEKVIGRRVRPADDVIEDVRITREEALAVLRADVDRVERVVLVYFPEYALLSEVRQRVCVDMAFNMGYSALKFKNTLAAIKARDWSTAAKELYRSKWAGQVGDGPGGHFDRADRLAKMLLTGIDYSA